MCRCGGSGRTCRISVMLAMTLGYFLVEIVVGYMTKSMALVADSFHMLSDVLALTIAAFCMKISKRRFSKKNTFGWVRAEVLGALVNAVFLLALCFSIFVEAIKRLLEPHEVEEPQLILYVGSVGLVVNLIGIFMFHGHASVSGHSHARPVPLDLEDEEEDKSYQLVAAEAHSISVLNTDGVRYHKGSANGGPTKDENSTEKAESPKKRETASQLNMHGVFLHILGDTLGSIIVVINAVIVWKVNSPDVKKYLDPSLSLLMVCIIASTTIPLLKESALILLQTVPTHLNIHEIKNRLTAIDGVLAVHDFHVWRLAGNKIIATAHIRCRNMGDYMRIAGNIKKFFHHEGIHSTTIQPEFLENEAEPETVNEEELNCVLPCPPSKTKCDSSDMCCVEVRGSNSRSSQPTNSDELQTARTEDSARPLIAPIASVDSV